MDLADTYKIQHRDGYDYVRGNRTPKPDNGTAVEDVQSGHIGERGNLRIFES